MSGAREEGATVPGLVVTDDLTPDELAFLEDRIYEYNVGATGIDDGRWLGVLVRDENGAVVAGLTGTTWGACCKVRDKGVVARLRRLSFLPTAKL